MARTSQDVLTRIFLTLEGGLEPPTLWLTARRSGQLRYSSSCHLTND
jgi:hypothetical protein